MNCLVTGGAGFIGSHIVKRLLGSGHRVWVIDNLKTGFESNIPAGADFIKGDLSNERTYKSVMHENIGTVFHIAAQSSGENSFYEPIYDLASNGEGTLRLLEFCRSANITRILFSSSMSVYGVDDVQNVKESELCQPHSLYGATKVLGEHYVRLYSRYGINYTIFRLFSVYGPGQNMANMRQGIVSIYMSYLLGNKPIHIKGPLDRYRDFTYIDDVVDAFMVGWENPVALKKIFNVGTGIKTSVGELITLMKDISQKSDYPVYVEGNTPGDIKGITADISLIKDTLLWTPHVSLEEGLSKMLAFYQK